MPRKWASIYPGLLALVLSTGLIVAGFGLVSGEEPPPSARPEKLDAVLTGLLARQKAAGEPTTGGEGRINSCLSTGMRQEISM